MAARWVIKAFAVDTKEHDFTGFADMMVDELKESYLFYCQKAAAWGNYGDYETARHFMNKASAVDTKIRNILVWNDKSQRMVVRWANKLLAERALIQ